MVGETIQSLRVQKGITQAELGLVINVTQRTVSKWETSVAEPDIGSLCTLADFFGVSVDFLVGHKPPAGDGLAEMVYSFLRSLTPEQMALMKKMFIGSDTI